MGLCAVIVDAFFVVSAGLYRLRVPMMKSWKRYVCLHLHISDPLLKPLTGNPRVRRQSRRSSMSSLCWRLQLEQLCAPSAAVALSTFDIVKSARDSSHSPLCTSVSSRRVIAAGFRTRDPQAATHRSPKIIRAPLARICNRLTPRQSASAATRRHSIRPAMVLAAPSGAADALYEV